MRKYSWSYKVVEKFISINGEGNLAGQLAIFIRFAGCNLQCSYCDTLWANNKDVKYETISEQDIYEYIISTQVTNVTLTGGEPLLQEGIEQLLMLLASDSSLHVEIETNGSVEIQRFSEISSHSPVFTMDYKLPSSGMEGAMKLKNFQYLRKQDTVKFVAGSMKDLEKVKNIINEYNLVDRCGVHISPVFGKMDFESLVDFLKDNRLNGVRLQLQERIGSDIAEIIQKVTGSDDAAVIIEGQHACMTARGIKNASAVTMTTTLRGRFHSDNNLTRKLMMMYNGQ